MTTRLTLKPSKEDKRLRELLDAANARVAAMSPAERAAMYEAQRRSWVVGEMMLEHPEMSRDEANNIYDRAIGGAF